VGPEADADPEGTGRILYDDIRIYNSSHLAPTSEVRVIEDFDAYGDQAEVQGTIDVDSIEIVYEP